MLALGIAIRHIICGFYLFIFPPCYVVLCACKARHRLSSESFSWCLETSLFLRLPSRDGAPSLPLLSLFLSFIFLPTSLRRQWAAFLGAWCPLPAFRSCFVEFKCSFDEFVGEKVVSLSYSSAILGPKICSVTLNCILDILSIMSVFVFF